MNIIYTHQTNSTHENKGEISKARRVITLTNNKIKCTKIGVNVMKS